MAVRALVGICGLVGMISQGVAAKPHIWLIVADGESATPLPPTHEHSNSLSLLWVVQWAASRFKSAIVLRLGDLINHKY